MPVCIVRIEGVRCQLDDGHDGPHCNFGASVCWASGTSALGYVADHPIVWKLLEALQRADWTEGEIAYLRNIVEEQPSRTWGLEKMGRYRG